MLETDTQLLLPLGPIRNSELFSNYWLSHRLRLEPDWLEFVQEAESVLAKLTLLWESQKSRVEKYGKEAPLEHAFIQPVFEALGWKLYYQAQIQGRKPDYALFTSDEEYDAALQAGHTSQRFWQHARVVADAKAWHVPLDQPSRFEGRKEYPPQQIEWYLDRTGIEWGILTNGKLWRLVPRVVPLGKPRFQTYLEIDLPRLIEETSARNSRDLHGEHLREFLVFYLLFSASAFRSNQLRTPLIQRALEGSSVYALGVGEDLKSRVFEALRLSVEGFLTHATNGLSPDTDLGICRENSFVLLYRLLFIMYAEDRGLLPYKINSSYTTNRSLGEFRNSIANTLERRGEQAFSIDSVELWKGLTELCDLVDVGGARFGVPAYNGGLFSPEQHPFLAGKAISDRTLAKIIDTLSRAIDVQHPDAGRFRVDYRDLAIRQLGSVYEGLLEMRPRYTTRELAVISATSTKVVSELYHPLGEKLPEGYRDTGERCPANSIYLATDKGERRATGSYYTPDHIVDHIIVSAIGQLCENISDQIRREIEDAQSSLHNATKPERDHLEESLKNLQQSFADRVLELRIIDPSMGSGHFLVRACQYLAEEIATSPYGPDADDESSEKSSLTYWKRRVAEECLFGVDVNPLAVELAKLALWLETVATDRPLAFLDSQLRPGDSLVGAWTHQLDRLPHGAQLFSGKVEKAFLKKRADLVESIHQLRLVTSDDVPSVKKKEKLFRQYESKAKVFRLLADVWCGDSFVLNDRVTDEEYDILIQSLSQAKQLDSAHLALWEKLSELGRLFFHWELEFPDVFFARTEDEGRGFDAVIGNPPYEVIASKESGIDQEPFKRFLQIQEEYKPSFVGKNNLYKLFICRAFSILKQNGLLSFIVPMALIGDENAVGLRKQILESGAFLEIHSFPQKDDSRNRVFRDAKLSTVIFSVIKTTNVVAKARPFLSKRHPGRTIEADSPSLLISTIDIPKYDPSNMTVVSSSQQDWDLAVRLMKSERFCRLGELCTSYQGEVNETTDKAFLSSEAEDGKEVLRGASVCLYALRDASQGESKYLNIPEFLKAKGKSAKVRHSEESRIGFQRSAPQNNFRRIIAAPIPIGEFCFDTVSYIPTSQSQLSNELLLSLLNSELLEWYFRLGSSNSKLNEYQFDNLPCPTFSSEKIMDASIVSKSFERAVEGQVVTEYQELICRHITIGAPLNEVGRNMLEILASKISEIEVARGQVSKSARAKLAPVSAALQSEINQILYRAAGFDASEVAGIRNRMKSLA